MKTKISGGRVILRDGPADNLSVYVEDGRITDVTDKALPFDREIDAAGAYVSPGFIEIHSHGAGGADFLDGSAEAFLTAAEKHARHGVTTLIPTATSAEMSGIAVLDRLLEEARARNTHGADMPGLHLEGPYFAYGQRGAQDPRYLRNPAPEEYLPILDRCRHILRWSVAPELPGALEMGRELKRRGILAAIGHSDAGFAEVEAAWDAGFTHVTHLYSGMSSLHRRNAYRYVGVVEAAYLIDGLTVEIIADGKHLPAELLKFVYKFKGPERTALVTDSMRGAGMPDGPSMLGHYKDGLPVIIEDDVAKLPDRTSFAGSVATFDRLVRNMLCMAQAPLADVITMASRTPARIMGFADRGEIAPGMRADLTFFDEDVRISRTMVEGRTVYQKGDMDA
ncbi:MAG: N-acetylglucosamine-6-phosphate deacetylase [Aristaeellaceae bacterium]